MLCCAFDLAQVDGNASQYFALTVDGKLLMWPVREGGMRRDKSCVSPSVVAWPSMLNPYQAFGSESLWESYEGPRSTDERGQAMPEHSTRCDSVDTDDTPTVWRIFADKARVADIACGSEHTLALLENGQVRRVAYRLRSDNITG